MDPQAIARRLIDLAAEAEPMEVEVQHFPLSEIEEKRLAQEFGAYQRYFVPATQMVGELQEALTNIAWAPEMSDSERTEQDRWTFGTAMIIRGTPRTIHRGFLQPLRCLPILSHMPERVALYLITIDE